MSAIPPAFAISAAVEASLLSFCQSKRGATIWNEHGVLCSGYNRKPTGFVCDRSSNCKQNCWLDAIHAEQMALYFGGYQAAGSEMLHVKTVNGVLVPSGPPSCLQCSKLIIQAEIQFMWLFHKDGWKRYTPEDFHRQSLIHGARKTSC